MRVIVALVLMIMALVTPAMAQDDATPWQATVTAQIEAFRASDGVAALDMAGKAFKAQFDDPDLFVAAIAASGYGPIVTSRSHSFGTFDKVSETQVLQVVRFVGPDQTLYEAVYQLSDEPDVGWRVQGVALRKEAGMGV